MAAIRAAKTTATPSLSCLTTLATVSATAVPTMKNALKLKNAENHGAKRAGMTRVATTVATELAASWKPLVKSNRSASAMTRDGADEHPVHVTHFVGVEKVDGLGARTIWADGRRPPCLSHERPLRLCAVFTRRGRAFHR